MTTKNNIGSTTCTARKTLLEPKKLLDIVVQNAIENYASGTFELYDEDVFRPTLTPIVKAWELPDYYGEHARLSVQIECERMEEHYDEYVSPELHGEQIISILATLTETIVRLDDGTDRLAVASLMDFLKDFWAVADNLD
jgi:hypothetical protein